MPFLHPPTLPAEQYQRTTLQMRDFFFFIFTVIYSSTWMYKFNMKCFTVRQFQKLCLCLFGCLFENDDVNFKIKIMHSSVDIYIYIFWFGVIMIRTLNYIYCFIVQFSII